MMSYLHGFSYSCHLRVHINLITPTLKLYIITNILFEVDNVEHLSFLSSKIQSYLILFLRFKWQRDLKIVIAALNTWVAIW